MNDSLRRTFVLTLIAFTNVKDVSSKLHIVRISVPEVMATGQPAWLDCDYAGGGNKIYALKWYLGLDEFYRWMPTEMPQKKTFPILHNPIEVDLEASEEGRVRVRRFSLEATGVYRCEVSAETPSFHTVSQISSLKVFDLPDSKPLITGIQRNYHLHEEVRLNCSSSLSYPVTNLTFYVNNDQADPSWLMKYKTIGDYSSPLQSAVLGLKFVLWPSLLHKGSVTVKCTSEISPLYFENSEAYLRVVVPQHASVMEGRASIATGVLWSSDWVVALLTTAISSFINLDL